MTPKLEAIFGNRTAARVAAFIERNGQGYAKQIASTFDTSVSQVQKQLQRLEAGEILVSTTVGRTRLYQWNTRSALVRALREGIAFEINAFIESDQQLAADLTVRQRPRRQGKSIQPASRQARPDDITTSDLEWLSDRDRLKADKEAEEITAPEAGDIK